jgi:hypothetical protein
MSQPELLRKVIQTLDAIGIDYMVTGSVASSLQGEPRLSHDIDIVVAVQPSAVPKLLQGFPPPDYYLDEESMRSAMASKDMFNLIDVKGGDKVDFWMLTDDAFDRSRFARKYEENFMGMKIKISRAEDSILMKLRWAELSGGSEKQFTDALRVYEVQFKNLDISYMEGWARALKVESLWKRVQSEAQLI